MMGENRGLSDFNTSSKTNKDCFMTNARSEFNKNRKFIIKNIPPVTYEEVKDFVGAFSVSNISISKKCRHAIVTLLHGEQADEAYNLLSGETLLGVPVEVTVLHNENLLCVTHLPFSFSEQDFKRNLEPYGVIEKCFLMRDSQTGESKGYGFVEYVHNKEKSVAACAQLDGRRMKSCVIQCAFLNSNVCHLDQLNSNCLLIDHIPANYTNWQELKNICSVVEQPTWFQLGKKDGLFLSFAVVSFNDCITTEKTQKMINGYNIGNRNIRVTYCRPGEKAKTLYDEIINIRVKRLETLKKAPSLLPSAETDSYLPMPNQYKLASPVVKKLLAENPDALGNFVQVLQTLQTQQHIKPELTGVDTSSLISGPLMNPNVQIALLAVLISIQIQQSQPGFIGDPSTQEYIMNSLQNQQKMASLGYKTGSLENPLINQANTMLQNMMLQNTINCNDQDTVNANVSFTTDKSFYNLFPGPENQMWNKDSLQDFTNILTALTPKSRSSYRARTGSAVNDNQYIAENMQYSAQAQTPSLLNLNQNNEIPSLLGLPPVQNPLTGNSQLGLLGPPPGLDYRPGILGSFHGKPQNQSQSDMCLADPVLASFIENQIKQHVAQDQNLKNTGNKKPVQLLDLPQNPIKFENNPAVNCENVSQINPQMRRQQNRFVESLKPTSISELGYMQSTPLSRNRIQTTHGNVTEKRILSFDNINRQLPAVKPHTNTSFNTSSFQMNGLHDINHSNLHQSYDQNNGSQSSGVKSLFDIDLSCGIQNPSRRAESLIQRRDTNTTTSYNSHELSFDIRSDNQRRITCNNDRTQSLMGIQSYECDNTVRNNQPQSLLGLNMLKPGTVTCNNDPWQSTLNQNVRNSSMSTHKNNLPVSLLSTSTYNSNHPQSFPDMTIAPSRLDAHAKIPGGSIQPLMPSSIYYPKSTPQGLKRKLKQLIPSPEDSPDGPYVGQHSQGIGGHYAESYSKKRIKI